MTLVARRVVGGREQVAVRVEHLFDQEAVVEAVMAVKYSVRPGPGVRVRPLRISDVREALRYAARHGGQLRHPVLAEYAAEPPGGGLHRLAQWIREELYRLELFSAEASG